ncbi:hypothetical protein MPDQ_000234 [Monascus purpureus]|uniref:ribose-phosphate diphosphokinase n=1 Tax=Monascus purpureus TaxID=5098 RepID=A0A507R3T2_MONPU|nr:hypothetical protein MPDQ_000234 [Monascus purpureus]
MLANLLTVAGVDHVITLDLHASQMQGFFGKPVDNLFAEPFIARWIRLNVPYWKDAVVVSKNAGGTKRVTSLADTLKLNFGIVTTDKRRPKAHHHLTTSDSAIFFDSVESETRGPSRDQEESTSSHCEEHGDQPRFSICDDTQSRLTENNAESSFESENVLRPETPQGARRPSEMEHPYTDVRAKDVITGRFVQGRIVDDDYPLATTSEIMSESVTTVVGVYSNNSESVPDTMVNSFISTTSSVQPEHALGGSGDAADSDDESHNGYNVEQEKMITLVGEVRDRTVFIVDDMIDKSGSWIAAAETVVKRGGANKVYCIATHGLFGNDSLDQMEACESIDYIVVTNTFPISPEKMKRSKKLIIIDISSLVAESMRRHHYGESVSALFHLND